jgi:hypothetical protein
MFDELRYRWALRKYLKEHRALYRAYDAAPDDPEEWADEPHVKHAMSREVLYQTQAMDYFRSKYLVEQAYRYHVPVPQDEDSWIQPRGAPERFLTAAAAQKLRADIRAEQKADWDYWANRVTLSLALIGSIFGVLAFFKK